MGQELERQAQALHLDQDRRTDPDPTRPTSSTNYRRGTLDTIAYANPASFSDAVTWLSYRSLTRATFSVADGLAFINEHGRQQAIAEGLLERGVTSRVVGVALNMPESTIAREPKGAARDLRPGFLLCIGASFRHKNRAYALAVLAELKRLGWPGQLVLAGPNPPYGHSLADEALYKLQNADPEDVVVLGSVSEGEKAWLYQQAALVLYPTVVEGFGIVPFEAAAHGAATLSSGQGALDEVLPPDIPTSSRWNASERATQILALLADQQIIDAVCASLVERAATYTSERMALELVALFAEVIAKPRLTTGAGLTEDEPGRVPRRQMGRSLADVGKAWVDRSGVRPVIAPPGSSRERVFQAYTNKRVVNYRQVASIRPVEHWFRTHCPTPETPTRGSTC